MRKYDGDGNLVGRSRQLVEEMGFTIGSHVCRKADKVVGSIESFEKDMVVLKIDEGHVSGRAQISYMSFIKKEWAKFTPKKDDEPIQEHWKMQPCSQTEWVTQIIKSQILLALHLAVDSLTLRTVAEGLLVVNKPTKYVKANRAFKKGEIQLVPQTTKICATENDYPVSGVPLGTLHQDLKFYLMPWTIAPSAKSSGVINPFFFVTTSDVLEECNLQIAPPNLEEYKIPGVRSKFAALPIKIPIMSNPKPVKAGERLVVYKEKATRFVEVEELVAHPEDEPEAPARKRRRTKGHE